LQGAPRLKSFNPGPDAHKDGGKRPTESKENHMTTRKPLGHALLLGFSLLAFVALPAMASGATLTNEEGEALEGGAPLQAFSNNLKLTNSNGVEILCVESYLSGEVTSNPPAEASIESGTFTGSGGGACTTNVSGITSDFTVHLSIPFRITSLFHWHLGSPVKITTGLTAESETVAFCVYERATSVSGTYTEANPTTLTIESSQTFVAVEGSSPICGMGATLTGSFSLSSSGGAVGIA
jgi:hypothetical protein